MAGPRGTRRKRQQAAVSLLQGPPTRRQRTCVERFAHDRLVIESSRGIRGPSRLLLDALGDQNLDGRVVVAGSPRGLLALAAGCIFPAGEVVLATHDVHEMRRVRRIEVRNPGISIHRLLTPDLAEAGPADWVVLPVLRTEERALTVDRLQQAWRSLAERGKLLAAIDERRDQSLRNAITRLFGSMTVVSESRRGAVYVARKRRGKGGGQQRLERSFAAALFGESLELETRPGVFAHGLLDEGTLALSEIATMTPKSRVVDLGCGSGALGVAAARVARRGLVILVDSSLIACRVARANILRHGVERNALVLPGEDLSAVREGAVDVALANPPYYGDFGIAETFARETHRVLAPGGRLHLVARARERHREILERHFGQGHVEETVRRGYGVFTARKKR